MRTIPQNGVAIPKVWGYFFGKFPLETGGFPRQFENWLGMTAFIRLHLPLPAKLKFFLHIFPFCGHTVDSTHRRIFHAYP